MRFITWDSGILGGLALLLAYSLLIRKHKSLATLVSLYVAYVIASAWGERIAEFFAGNRVLFNQVWIQANASPPLVQAVLMILVAFLLSSFIKLAGRRSRYSMVEVAVYAVCTLALAVMFILSFLSPEQRALAMESSKLVPYIYNWREIILVVPVLAMIFFGIYADEE